MSGHSALNNNVDLEPVLTVAGILRVLCNVVRSRSEHKSE